MGDGRAGARGGVDGNGVPRAATPAPLAASEKQKNEEDARARRAEEIAAVEQRRNDSAILSRFRSEDDIVDSGRRNVAIVQENVKREMQVLSAAGKRQQAAEAELAQLPDGNARPAYRRQRREEADRGVQAHRRALRVRGRWVCRAGQ